MPLSPVQQAGSSDIVSKYFSAVGDGLSGLKSSFNSIVSIYRLYNELSKDPSRKKEAAMIFKQLTEAAVSGAKVAKSAYDIINDGIPMGIIYAIPALGIGVSTINLMIRFADALTAGERQSGMLSRSQAAKAAVMGDVGLQDENNIFQAESHGTWPFSKTYLRVKINVIENVKLAKEKSADKFNDNAKDDSAQVTFGLIESDFNTKIQSWRHKNSLIGLLDGIRLPRGRTWTDFTDYLDRLKARADSLEKPVDVDDETWNSFRGDFINISNIAAEQPQKVINAAADETWDELNVQELQSATLKTDIARYKSPAQAQTQAQGQAQPSDPQLQIKTSADVETKIIEFQSVVDRIRKLWKDIEEYEFADKMVEINSKRKVGGWTDVFVEMVSIAGDITTLATGATGIGALVGQAIKAGAGGFKLIKGAGRLAQSFWRNRSGSPSSDDNKHRDYVRHAKFIYGQIADFSPTSFDETKWQSLMELVQATGVNVALWARTNNQGEQIELLIEAMKAR